MARTQSLIEWATDEFGKHAPAYRTLLLIAKNNMISPPAKKVGKKWMVDKDARYVGMLAAPVTRPTDHPKLKRILSDGCETENPQH